VTQIEAAFLVSFTPILLLILGRLAWRAFQHFRKMR